MRYNKLMAIHNAKTSEVVIAGSIILAIGVACMVTIPIFNLNHRNAERTRHLNLVTEALIDWQADHEGNLPSLQELSALPELSELSDPDGTPYQFVIDSQLNRASALPYQGGSLDHKIYISYGSSCAGSFPIPVGNHQKFSVFYKLEGANSNYCADNSTQ